MGGFGNISNLMLEERIDRIENGRGVAGDLYLEYSDIRLSIGTEKYPTLMDAFNYAATHTGMFDIYLPIGIHDLDVSDIEYSANINFIGEDNETSILNLIVDDTNVYKTSFVLNGMLGFYNLQFNYNEPSDTSSYRKYVRLKTQRNLSISNCTMSNTSYLILFQASSSFGIYTNTLDNSVLLTFGSNGVIANSVITNKIENYTEHSLKFYGGSAALIENSTFGGTNGYTIPEAILLSDGGVFALAGTNPIQNANIGIRHEYGSQIPEGNQLSFNNVIQNYANPINVIDSHGGFTCDTRENENGIEVVHKPYLLSAEYGNSLPVSDPLVAGEIWNNGGILTISAG